MLGDRARVFSQEFKEAAVLDLGRRARPGVGRRAPRVAQATVRLVAQVRPEQRCRVAPPTNAQRVIEPTALLPPRASGAAWAGPGRPQTSTRRSGLPSSSRKSASRSLCHFEFFEKGLAARQGAIP